MDKFFYFYAPIVDLTKKNHIFLHDVEKTRGKLHPTLKFWLENLMINFWIFFLFQPQTSQEDYSESEEEENSGNEKEPVVAQTTKKVSKTMKKNISKSISELQTLKQKSKSSVAKVKKASKFQKKTAKSKRSKHYHPKKNTTK